MVKKACNKYQTTARDCWSVAAATKDEDREEAPAGPVSPTEGCVAPPSPGAYYRPLAAITTQHSKSQAILCHVVIHLGSQCFWTMSVVWEIVRGSKRLGYKSRELKLLKTALSVRINCGCFFPLY